MATITIEAITNLPQFGLKAGQVGEVDEDHAKGPLDQGFAAKVTAAKAPKKPAETSPDAA